MLVHVQSERRIFTNFHRQVFCWTDEWYGLTMKDIRAIEDKTKEELDQVSRVHSQGHSTSSKIKQRKSLTRSVSASTRSFYVIEDKTKEELD